MRSFFGERPYILRLVPLDADNDPSGARAAIVIIDLDHDAKPSKELPRGVLRLTRTETEVALHMLVGDGFRPSLTTSTYRLTPSRLMSIG